MKLSNQVSGLAVALLGIAAFWGGSKLPPVPGQQVGPSVFPMVIGAGLALLGVLIALRWGQSFEDAAEAELAEHTAPDPDAEAYAHARRFHVLLPPALLIGYFLVSETIGFVPTAAAMIGILAYAFGAKMRFILPVAIGGSILIHLVFLKLLRVPLPPGLLPMPW